MATDNIPYGPDPATIGRRTATRSRTEDNVVKQFDRVLVEDNRIRSFRGVGATFRIPGSGATPQNLWSIENATGSTVAVALRKLLVVTAQTVANATHPPWFALTRITALPTGGTPMGKAHPDGRSAEASSASVVVRQGASADGTASAITATAAGTRFATEMGGQLYTAAGVLQPLTADLLENVTNEGELILGPGQAYLLQAITAAAADNIATRSYLVDFAFEEFQDF